MLTILEDTSTLESVENYIGDIVIEEYTIAESIPSVENIETKEGRDKK